MKIVKIVIALLVIAGTGYWAYDSVRTRSYEGTALQFTVGNGSRVNVSHDAEEPVTLDMTASAGFAVTSTNTELSGTGTREGTGRDVVFRHQVELPAGTSDFRVTRGSNITFSMEGARGASAEVTPMDADSARSTVLVALVVMLAALYYVSRTLDHRWLKAILSKASPGSRAAAQTSASEAGH